MSVAAAPWGKCAFFGALSGAAQELFDNFGIDSELFEIMYPKLSHHCHRGHIPFFYGTDEHKRSILQWCSEAPPLTLKGPIAKHGRWFQVMDRSLVALHYWSTVELIGTYMGLIEGWAVQGPEHADEPVVAELPGVPEAGCVQQAQGRLNLQQMCQGKQLALRMPMLTSFGKAARTCLT